MPPADTICYTWQMTYAHLCQCLETLGLSCTAAFVPENGKQHNDCIYLMALPTQQLLSIVCSKSILRFEFGVDLLLHWGIFYF